MFRFAVLCLCSLPLIASEWWAFDPPDDPYSDEALLDLRHLNEAESGQSGFIRVDEAGTGFVRGDGKPIRFWAVATNPQPKWSPAEIDAHFRFLAKRGVNFVRMHCHIADESDGAAITDIDEQELDTIFRMVAAAKQNGIYLLISPYWWHRKIPTSWGLEGYQKGDMPAKTLFWNEAYQAAYREWTRVLYTTENPYTGLAIRNDATVAMIKMKNEDGLFWWGTFTKTPEPQLDLLRARFARWASEEYGSLDAALAAWNAESLDGDDPDSDRLGFLNVWELTQPNERPRLADQLRFMAELQRGFYADVVAYVTEELGCQQLTASMSWRSADKKLLEDIERWTYTVNDVLTQNVYFHPTHKGKHRAWRIDPHDHMVNYSATREPWRLPTNVKQTVGQPTVLTEIAWVIPNRFQSEGPLMTAAHQSLVGIAATCWFGMNTPEWHVDPFMPFGRKENGGLLFKWAGNHPMQTGMFPAAALMYRLGLVQQGETVVHEERSLDELWRRDDPIIAEGNVFDPIQDAVDRTGDYEGGAVSRLAFLTGRVEVAVHEGEAGEDRVAELAPLIDTEAERVVSTTGELHYEYGDGLWRLTAPAAQAVAGFLGEQAQPIDCGTLRVRCGNDYATVAAVAMDGKPLSESRKILVQLGTVTRPTGWKTSPATFGEKGEQHEGLRIDNTGHGPLRVEPADCRIELANPALTTATVLDANGYATGTVEIERVADGIAFAFPADALYCLLGAE